MQLRLDPWPAEYESAIQLEEIPREAGAKVDATVETSEWEAIRPRAAADGEEIWFVDGVRRVEARVLAEVGEKLVHGLFGSLAAGAVRSRPGTAVFEDLRVRRFLILGAGFEQAETVWAGNAAVPFEALATPANTPAEVLGALQNQMRICEALLAETLIGAGRRVFVDGPLSYFSGARQEIVGIIKTIHELYVGAAQFRVAAELPAGCRTPLFAITDGKYDRYAWFLRVAEGRAIDHKLAGILRLEVRAAVGLERARALADLAAAVLPRFASSAAREARAPQNLLPVGALEEELRRRLGDPLMLRRAIEARLYEGVAA
jgi:hypothetical protein